MNTHGVNFKLVKHADRDFRVEFWQSAVFYTCKEFRTRAAAKTYKQNKEAFFARNPDAYLFYPE
tara:strand:- start:1526 stop:1717 length:192 start_codon:yes stop_codon:yes gene_type:complete